MKKEDLKQVIVVRTDLKMGKGKIVAQGCHASVSSFLEARKTNSSWADKWLKTGQKKVVLKVGSEEELFSLYQEAKLQKLPCSLINDAGLTQLPPGTTTALGIGPAPSNFIDSVTGGLKLL